jgi:hypothetical protein
MNPPRSMPIVAFLLALAVTVSGQTAAKVGALGNTAAITFDGNAHFSADELRAGLRQQSAYIVASHPDAPLEAYLTQISEALARGYRKYGFQTAKARATVNAAGDGILVRIEEGQQLLNGAVVVKGVDEHLAGALRERLAVGKTDTDGHNDALWVPGKPSNFEDSPRIGRMVTEELREQGWFTAESRVELQAAAEVVTLIVIVDDLGVESVIGAVKVEGTKRHSSAQIREFLGFAAGDKVHGGLLADSRQRLYDSGRFIESKVAMERRRPEGAVVDLTVTVQEAQEVPLLSESLPRYVEGLLKSSAWLANFQRSPHDIVLSGTGEGAKVDLAISPAEGLLLALRFPQSTAAKADVVVLLSTTHVLVKTNAVDGVWRYDISLPVQAEIGLRATGETDKRFRFVAEAKTRKQGTDVTFPLKISIAPVAIAIGLEGFIESPEDLLWNGDVMSLEADGAGFSFDTASGRLLKAFAKDEDFDLTLRTEEGGYQRLYEAFVGDDAEKNHFQAEAPLSSSASFLVSALPTLMESMRVFAEDDDEYPSPEEVQKFTDVARIFLDLGLLKPLDAVFKKVSDGTGQLFSSRFRIPQGGGPVPENPTMLLIAQLMSAVLEVLPEDSWADRFSREMVHVAHGNTVYTEEVLGSLYQDTDHVGPVGYLMMAKMLGFLDPKQASIFAEQGMKQLSADAFALDWKLLAMDPAMEQAFLEFVSAVPKIDDESRATLDRLFGEGATEELTQLFAEGDSEEGEAFVDFIAPLMADLWVENLKRPVRQQLQKLVRPKAEPPRTIARVNGVPVPHTAMIPWSDGRTPEQAIRIAIMTEVVHQHYLEELAKDQPDLLKQILTQGKPQMNMLMGAGMPPEVAMKALLYQHLIQRTTQGVPPASAAEAQAYYTLHKADIGRPFADVKDDLVRHLTQMRGMKLVERWLSRLYAKADVKLGGPKPPVKTPPKRPPAKTKAKAEPVLFEPRAPAADARILSVKLADSAALEHILPVDEKPIAKSIEIKNGFARSADPKERVELTYNQHFERIDEVHIRGRIRPPGRHNFRFLIGSFWAINNWEFKYQSRNLYRNMAAPPEAGKRIVEPAMLKPGLHEIIVRRVGTDVELWVDGTGRFASEGQMGAFDMSGTVTVYGPIEIEELTIVGVPSDEPVTPPKLK